MTPRASSLSASLLERSDGQLAKLAWQVITVSHSAQDIRAYDCIKDVSRVEKFANNRPGADGAVVVLTNDSNYWTARNTAGRLTPTRFNSSCLTAFTPFRVHLSMLANPAGIAYN